MCINLRDLLGKMSPKQLVTFFDSLKGSTALADYTQEIKDLVYLYVNSSGRHEVLLGSEYFTSYVHFLVSRKLIDDLLVRTIQANKVAEAIQLVELYSHCHHLSSQSGMDLLKEYLNTRSLSHLKETLELKAV